MMNFILDVKGQDKAVVVMVRFRYFVTRLRAVDLIHLIG